MKTPRILLTLVLLGFFSLPALAQTLRNDTLHVSGNCGMCKKKIEAPFKHADGIESASWDKKAKLFVVSYDPKQISLQKIKDMILGQGYDTEGATAPEEAYNKLPKCCRYRSGGHDD